MTSPFSLARLDAAIPVKFKTRGAALLAVAVLQLGILGVMIGERIHLLKTGREIVLKTHPVDPRDLLKGDFARLGYDISTIPNELKVNLKLKPETPVYVTIAQATDGGWRVAKVNKEYPPAVAANEAVLRAVIGNRSGWGAFLPDVRYGIERYYVPEGTGHDIEKVARERRLEVIVTVGTNGDAAIKGLSIDGKKVYDEPLF